MKITKFQTLSQVNKAINAKIKKDQPESNTKKTQEISLESLLQSEFIDQKNLESELIVKKFIKVVLIKALGENIIDHTKYSDMNQSIYNALKSQNKTFKTLISEIKDCVK